MMFTVYALSLSDDLDTETECATLEEALMHLRELITSEMEDADGPAFDRYGIYLCAEKTPSRAGGLFDQEPECEN